MSNDKTVKLLLIEDDEDDYTLALDYLNEMLEFDFEITWLSDFDEIIHTLEQTTFDLCLLDHHLGAYTGLSVLKAAKEMGNSTSFIMLTGLADEVLDKQALELGAEDFLVKSEINSVRFIRAIRYALSRKELTNERLERLRVEADNRAKDRFLAHLSHELRTPLTSIMGYTDLLLSRKELDNIKPELTIINNNSLHLLNLLNDVLDLSKIKANTLSLSKEWLSLNSFLVDLQSLFQMAARKKNLCFSITARGPLPDKIYNDTTRMRQVLTNFIYNAIKFTDEGSIKVELELKHTQLHVYIKDTGIGIPPENLIRIFKPFEQVQNTTTKTNEGAGLGLAISSALIELLGGGLTVESALGQGSLFSFYVDILNEHTSPSEIQLVPLNLRQAPSEVEQMPLPQLGGHVLVVEDIPEIRFLISDLIEKTGVTVTAVNNGKQAVDTLSLNQHIDLAFMDLHMPQMDGHEAIVAIRKQGIEIPVVALTAAAQKGNKETLKALGFNDCLTKPIDVAKLNATLTYHLGSQNQDEHSETFKKSHNSSAKRILLVEDDNDARELMTLLLSSLDANVCSAHNIESSLNVYADQAPFDLVLLDLTLPDGSGFDAVTKIQALNPHQDIVIVSGSDPDPQKLATANIDKVLLKPVSLPDLQALIESL
ncbi:hybrid sensor histidine kinase/response regulator [Pseudoalteromonas sp. MMG022]|uniref:hybrid sensor histidine kinase/response regulator n=1 Tax=Pseudoalteromonas sp. MMG022 TaxID=2909978 RepID=UPI001EFFC33B|nr:hybrid sensor histidine kinase/response regulator [Pseudoalteromonas sp. MMG022]MCF6436291.1 response regulator [Pseudoalteromonas sp. MMG022]